MTIQTVNLIVAIAQIVSCAGAVAAFVYGFVAVIRHKKPLYMKIVVMSIACVGLSRLFDIFTIIIEGNIRDGFGLGRLGILGTFLGFLSANFGQMDSIIDEKKGDTLTARIVAFAAPLIAAAGLVLFFFSECTILEYIFFTVVFIVLGIAGYFNLKHILIDDALGLAKAIRWYNVMALVFELLSIVEILGFTFGSFIPYCIAITLEGIVLPFIIISLNRGVSRWFK